MIKSTFTHITRAVSTTYAGIVRTLGAVFLAGALAFLGALGLVAFCRI